MSRLESRMKNLETNPPPCIEREVEDAVMDSISQMPLPTVLHLRRQRRIAAGTALTVLSVVLLIFFQNPSTKEVTNTDYVENRIYLLNHTSIWLTPVAVQHGSK
jgi:hypothetical protein